MCRMDIFRVYVRKIERIIMMVSCISCRDTIHIEEEDAKKVLSGDTWRITQQNSGVLDG